MIEARPEELPVINTHALGKFEFCPRAGLIAFEMNESEDADDTRKTPRLDYLPRFELAKLREAEKEIEEKWKQLSGILTIVAGFLALIAYLYDRRLALFLALAAIPLCRLLYLYLLDYIEISKRLRREKAAKLFTLPDPASGPQRFNWWSLLKKRGGYASNEPGPAYFDANNRLSGKPHRIVTRRTSRIPVIRHGERLDQAKPYHYIRLGAYALLIEGAETIDPVTWGIIVEPESMSALAVPIGSAEKEMALHRLRQFRKLLGLVAADSKTKPPRPPESFCRGCPYGRPRVYRPGETDTKLAGREWLKVALADDGRRYHSICGDRFGWAPPHARAIEKGIRS